VTLPKSCFICSSKTLLPISVGSLYRCSDCGLYINSKYPSKEALASALKEFTLTTQYNPVHYNERVKEANEQLAIVEEHVKPGRIFDVACGGGVFLGAAKKRGWSIEGNDLSKSAYLWALESLGITINLGYFEDCVVPDDEYSAVVLWNALEHTHNPKECIQKAYSMLKSGGVIHIRVPDRNPENVSKYYEDGHRIEFNAENLCRLLEDVGFKKIFSRPGNDGFEAVDALYKK